MYKQSWDLVNENEFTAHVLQTDYLRWTSCINSSPCGQRELYKQAAKNEWELIDVRTAANEQYCVYRLFTERLSDQDSYLDYKLFLFQNQTENVDVFLMDLKPPD